MATTTQLSTAAVQHGCTMDHHNRAPNFELQTPLPATSDDSEEEEAADILGLQVDGQDIIGFSISRAQTRLTSPAIPAAEKAALLFDSIDGKLDDYDGLEADAISDESPDLVINADLSAPVRSESPDGYVSSPLQQTSPDSAGPKPFETGSTPLSDERRPPHVARKFLPFTIPSWSHLLSSSKVSEKDASRKSAIHGFEHVATFDTSSNGTFYSDKPALPPPMSRTTSESQYFLARQQSLTPTLGDDSRWKDVNVQVNSRVRAIRDTWHDSNFKLPRMPNISRLNFGAPWHEVPELEELDGRMTRGHYEYMQYMQARHTSMPLNGGTSTPKSSKSNLVSHPRFAMALEELEGDIVILGGYRGSVLRSATPPHRQLWVPLKVGLNLRKANLELGFNPEDELHSEDLVIPSGMLKNIGPIDISRRLFKLLKTCKNAREGKLRVWDHGYDWRLSPHTLSEQLVRKLESLPCNSELGPKEYRGAIVIAHSLGGLITRHAVNTRPDLFGGVLYAGVPQTCVNILGPLRNGDDVGLSSKVLTAQVNFSIRTTFALLPLDGKCFLDADTKEEYPVDFFDVKTWEEHAFSPCISRPRGPISSPSGFINRAMGSVVSVLPGTSRRNVSRSTSSLTRPEASSDDISSPTNTLTQGALSPQMGKPNPQELGQNDETNASTAVTIPKEVAVEYLTRTLAEVKRFKQELAFRPENADIYPPAAVLFGKSIPTVVGCKVKGREGIRQPDAYERLTFGSGDGVVLSRAAQIPEGYSLAKGGLVATDRGHMSLLGDLEAVGKCLNAILAERRIKQRKEVASKSGWKGDFRLDGLF